MIKALSLNKTKPLIWFVGLTTIASVLPLFHNQALTGPLVNATLFLGVCMARTQTALFIGLIPSIIALSVGLLPPALAPMIPFIMFSNAILIVSFSFLKEKSFLLAVIASSFLKFLFLFSSSFLVINLLLKKELAQKVSQMLSWPQLITALIGGLICFLILRILK